ncbi:MAG: RimK family alpha-L-glutamate ligase, partial [Deltaproteobacteria bacterium]
KEKVFLIQEFIKSSRGRDLRVFTIGHRAVACVERIGPRGDFRANFSLGGSVKAYPMSAVIEELAIKTVRALGLEIGGIDLLFEGDKFRVCEANFSPGFESIEKCFNLDIPEKIFNYIKDR